MCKLCTKKSQRVIADLKEELDTAKSKLIERETEKKNVQTTTNLTSVVKNKSDDNRSGDDVLSKSYEVPPWKQRDEDMSFSKRTRSVATNTTFDVAVITQQELKHFENSQRELIQLRSNISTNESRVSSPGGQLGANLQFDTSFHSIQGDLSLALQDNHEISFCSPNRSIKNTPLSSDKEILNDISPTLSSDEKNLVVSSPQRPSRILPRNIENVNSSNKFTPQLRRFTPTAHTKGDHDHFESANNVNSNATQQAFLREIKADEKLPTTAVVLTAISAIWIGTLMLFT